MQQQHPNYYYYYPWLSLSLWFLIIIIAHTHTHTKRIGSVRDNNDDDEFLVAFNCAIFVRQSCFLIIHYFLFFLHCLSPQKSSNWTLTLNFIAKLFIYKHIHSNIHSHIKFCGSRPSYNLLLMEKHDNSMGILGARAKFGNNFLASQLEQWKKGVLVFFLSQCCTNESSLKCEISV